MLFFTGKQTQKKLGVLDGLPQINTKRNNISYMNILRCLLILSALASLLITGPNLAPIQSYSVAAAGDSSDHKIIKDYKNSIDKDVNAESDRTSQHLGQDDFCYKGDDCVQASEGQQIAGKDNEASGFNDQSRNLQQQAVTPTATPTQPPTPPTTGTLNICKTVINQVPGLTFQPSDFTFNFSTPANPSTFQGANEGCTLVTVAPGTYAFAESIPQFVTGFGFNITGGCDFVDFTSNPEGLTDGVLFNGTIAAGETQTCALSNAINAAFPGGG
jgi:hypothetical protein